MIGWNFKIPLLSTRESVELREFEDPVRVMLLLVALCRPAGSLVPSDVYGKCSRLRFVFEFRKLCISASV